MKDPRYYPLPTESITTDAVILANGNFPSHSLPLTILKHAKFVVCCDGAVNEYAGRGFTPNAIVGDGDSLSAENKERFVDIIHYSSDQETNDLTKAIDYCISQHMKNIVIVGATGQREDHTIGNVSLLGEYIEVLDQVEIISDYGVFTAIKTDATFESFIGQSVSIFLLNATPIKGYGLKYPLSTFTKWWQGTLNVATSNSFTLFVKDKVLVYRAF